MTSATKHTPGPWHNNGGIIGPKAIYHEPGHAVATVGTPNEQTRTDTANARLIAAAPDLLAVLASSRHFVAAWTANHESKIGERMLRKIDAAIEQAKGE